ncbi:hypothetical protein ACLOJK_032187 [Asimina triloba]
MFWAAACAGEQFCIGYTEDLRECNDTCMTFMLGSPNCTDPTQVPPAADSVVAVAPPKPPRPSGKDAPQRKYLEAAAAATTAKTASQDGPVPPSAPPSDSCFYCCNDDFGE